MGVFGRLRDVVRARMHRLLDRAEDPRDTLDLSYTRQMEELAKLRHAVAEVATAKKRVEMQARQLQQQAAKLHDQARQALAQGNEALAREALTRRGAVGDLLAELDAQHAQVAEQQRRLVETTRRVQAQVEAFRTRKETLKASYSAAEAQTRIGEAVAGISDSLGSAGLALQRAQDRITAMQARAGAMDELITSGALPVLGAPHDDIQAELDKAGAGGAVELELARLRDELASSPAPPAIGPGSQG